MRATADGRANQHARLLGGRKSAKSFEAHQAGEQEAESHSVQLTAKHLSLQNTRTRTTSTTANLRLLHGP